MSKFYLKDWHGKEKEFTDEKIFVRGEDGELIQFTQGEGGGSSADVRYVTFMSYDGLTEYGKKAVAVGDDCADPIARGIFATPTRESDAQYNYTFYGWATAPNGAADSNWNKAITEDKTVYANFAAAVRYYTITYYDSDGTTVLKTESLAYGAMPSYSPTKDGVTFDGWSPDLAVVTGNASYIAKWAEKPSFAGSTWAKIAEISEAGQAADYFSIGDTRTIDFTATDGTIYQATLAIADFAHDPLASDTSIKAGMTIDCMMVPNEMTAWANGTSNTCVPTNSKWIVDDFLTTVKTQLPAELQAVIKQVKKTVRASASNETSRSDLSFYLFPYTDAELGVIGGTTSTNSQNIGTLYPLFETRTNVLAANIETGEAVDYWIRSVNQGSNLYINPLYITKTGLVGNCSYSSVSTAQKYVRFGFCI